MHENLFNHVDIKPENIHIPDGTVPEDAVDGYCRHYEQAIVDAGGIDLQILGIGRTGHIGFNEPGSHDRTRTRMITLDRVTRRDAASGFASEDQVPRRAITMGVATILEAREVIIMAWGTAKAEIVARAVEGEISADVSASYLQWHAHATFVMDQAASGQLTRVCKPWLAGEVNWCDTTIRKAVVGLALESGKSILKLTAEDYNAAGLSDLLSRYDQVDDVNLQVFRAVKRTITGWPGGKPPHKKEAGDIARPHDDIFPKRVVIFSPHPDDDVISMGGTFIRLADQGHDVHVAYQTSGNIAVFDADVERHAEFMQVCCAHFGIAAEDMQAFYTQIMTDIQAHQTEGKADTDAVRAMKGLIRQTEATAGARASGIPNANCHFMRLPFYETGHVKKSPLGEADIEQTVALLTQLKPHLIFAAGDLADPHGTHRTCLTAVLKACERLKSEDWYQTTEVWFYRGAWAEFPIEEIEMAVPLSPRDVKRKRTAIHKHESQKDAPVFPGADPREFWQRAEERTAETADLYNAIGMSEYAAIEGFVRWNGDPNI